jgi:hypothetical protein
LSRIGRFFENLDKKGFLHSHIWEFGYWSFFKEYARLFFLKAILGHPWKTARGLKEYRRFIKNHKNLFPLYRKSLAVPDEEKFANRIQRQNKGPLLGLGFCLKPYDPEDKTLSCPSGRANHECLYLEKGRAETVCLDCSILGIAKKGLRSGCKVYIMTSAQDIAKDFLLPQIDRGSFPTSVLLLCPYSVQAILPSLFICGIHAFLIAYESGYCKDYKEWRLADLGTKEDRTTLSEESQEILFDLLGRSDVPDVPPQSFRRAGNIFYPE